MKHSYPLIEEAAGVVPTGVAVQWGNYEHRDPRSGKQVTIAELVQFAQEFLKVDYVFWSMQEPFFSEQVVPSCGKEGLRCFGRTEALSRNFGERDFRAGGSAGAEQA